MNSEEDPQVDVARLLPARTGHFLLESGHHGELWLDLELLCLRPGRVQRLADRLAALLAKHAVDVVCGPLVEGAFVGLMVASVLEVPFTYSKPYVDVNEGLFPVKYAIPPVLRPEVRGRRVAIVNDVINAGSAVRGTLIDLRDQGAVPVVFGTLAVLGHAAGRLAADAGVALERLATIPNEIWPPADCPLCARCVPLVEQT